MHQTFFLNFCAAAQVLPFFLKFVIHILARILNSWPSCGSVIEGEKALTCMTTYCWGIREMLFIVRGWCREISEDAIYINRNQSDIQGKISNFVFIISG